MISNGKMTKNCTKPRKGACGSYEILDEVIFEKDGEGNRYDPELGEWIEEAPITVTTNANVTDLGTDRSVAIFGIYDKGRRLSEPCLFLLFQNMTALFLMERHTKMSLNAACYQRIALSSRR